MKVIYITIGIVVGFWIGTINQQAVIADYITDQRQVQLELELDLAEADYLIASAIEQPLNNLVEEIENLTAHQRNNMFVDIPFSGRENVTFGTGGRDTLMSSLCIDNGSLMVVEGVLHDNQLRSEDIPQ